MSKRLIYEEDAIAAVAKGLKGVFVEYQDVAEKLLKNVPSAQPIDVQEAYCRGKIDGIKECTTRLKKMNDEVANGRHNQQTSSQAS